MGSSVMRASGNRWAGARTAVTSSEPDSTPPFSLKSRKPYRRWARLGEADDCFGCHSGLRPETFPLVGRLGRGPVGKIGAVAVSHEEQVAEHRHCAAVPPVAEQFCDRYCEVLAEQVEQGRLQRCHRVDGGARRRTRRRHGAGVRPGLPHPGVGGRARSEVTQAVQSD